MKKIWKSLSLKFKFFIPSVFIVIVFILVIFLILLPSLKAGLLNLGTGVNIENINKEFASVRDQILVIVAGIVILFFISLNFLIKIILKPLNENIKISEQIARGDLAVEIKVKGNDEISKLSWAMNKMKTELSTIIRNIIQLTEILAGTAREVNSTADTLSNNSNEQASNVEEISSTIEEINAAVAQNSQNSKTTDQIARDSALLAHEGNKAVKETVNSINKIAEKITLVQEIAKQTNLLALNASIEASRAGKHGKGFAVVASEVRKLSQKSQFAAQEINNLAGTSVTVAANAGEQLDKIVSSINKTAELVQSISNSSEQQSTGVEQVSNSMNQLANLTQGTAASSEELASASEMMKEHSINLNQIVTYFKLEEEQTDIELTEEE